MASVGLFFGSDTGNTEAVAKMIQKQLGKQLVQVQDIAKAAKKISITSITLLGIPTWYYGEAQCDWDDFFPELEAIDFSTKTCCYLWLATRRLRRCLFCDAMGTIRDIVEAKAVLSTGLHINWLLRIRASKGLVEGDDSQFVGLCIDEDRQPELTDLARN